MKETRSQPSEWSCQTAQLSLGDKAVYNIPQKAESYATAHGFSKFSQCNAGHLFLLPLHLAQPFVMVSRMLHLHSLSEMQKYFSVK